MGRLKLERIGIFGGTFDPPHYAHLILAERTLDALSLDKVFWVPAGDPPHKRFETLTASKKRIEMIELTIQNHAGFELSTVDIDRAGPHYTVDMVRLFQGEHPGAVIYFLMGGDSLSDLEQWHLPGELIELAQLVVMERPSIQFDIASLEANIPGLSERVEILDAPLVEIASTDIRAMRKAGKSIRYLLPEPVYDYIHEHQLYIK